MLGEGLLVGLLSTDSDSLRHFVSTGACLLRTVNFSNFKGDTLVILKNWF